MFVVLPRSSAWTASGSECAGAAAATNGGRQGHWQDLESDVDSSSVPDLCGSSESGRDDEWCGGDVGYDKLFGDSEPVQSLRVASSAVCAEGADSACAYGQGVQGEPAEHADVGCSTSGSTGWSWADVDVLPAAPPDDWQPAVPSTEWAEQADIEDSEARQRG